MLALGSWVWPVDGLVFFGFRWCLTWFGFGFFAAALAFVWPVGFLRVFLVSSLFECFVVFPSLGTFP